MASKSLPKHLASLLRHQPKDFAAGAVQGTGGSERELKEGLAQDATTQGKQRRRAARVKRRKAKAAVRREQEEAARRAAFAKKELAARAAADDSAKQSDGTRRKDTTGRSKLVKVKSMKKSARSTLESKNTVRKTGSRLDDEAAQEDAKLMQHLGAKLGLNSDPGKRQRAEKQIFEDLGFGDGFDIGVEEPPSSGEDMVPSDDEPAKVKGEELSSLLDNIMVRSGGSSITPATSKRKLDVPRRGLKRR